MNARNDTNANSEVGVEPARHLMLRCRLFWQIILDLKISKRRARLLPKTFAVWPQLNIDCGRKERKRSSGTCEEGNREKGEHTRARADRQAGSRASKEASKKAGESWPGVSGSVSGVLSNKTKL